MKQEDLPDQFKKWSSHFSKWYSWLDEYQISPLNACLNYAMHIDDIDKVVIGIDNAGQLDEICMINHESGFVFPDYLMSQDEMLINPQTGYEKIVAIIQARMSSSRLPGKVLLPLADSQLYIEYGKD